MNRETSNVNWAGDMANFAEFLYDSARTAKFILEIGIGLGNGSTAALNEGVRDSGAENPLHISVDILDYMTIKPIFPWWYLIVGDSTDPITVEAVRAVCGERRPDIIFIDTIHFGGHVWNEMNLWAPLTHDGTVWLFHDTWLWGVYNNMTDAIKRFAQENSWVYDDVYTEMHGLGRMRRQQ
jgi:cephalosporin hydroxylase